MRVRERRDDVERRYLVRTNSGKRAFPSCFSEIDKPPLYMRSKRPRKESSSEGVSLDNSDFEGDLRRG